MLGGRPASEREQPPYPVVQRRASLEPRGLSSGGTAMLRFYPRALHRLSLPLAVFLMLVLPAAPAVHGSSSHRVVARANGAPSSPSGANSAYPLNHTLDSTITSLGTPPTNNGFEQAASAVGTPPTNSGFSSGDFSGWTTSGTTSIGSDAGNSYATLGSSGAIISSPFSVDAHASSISLRAKYPSGIFAGQFNLYVLSGSGYGTSTTLASNVLTTTTWQTFRYDVSAFAGQTVELKVANAIWTVAVDDVGLQQQDVPGWTTSGTTREVAGGPNGNYASTTGTLTSSPFTIAAGTQNLSLQAKGGTTGASFHLELLSGTSYGTVTDLSGVVTLDPSSWKTIKVGVSAFAGQTVELRLRQTFGTGLFDQVALGESVLPSWTLASADPIAAGADTSGSYVAPYNAQGGLQVKSSVISSGIIPPPGGYVGQQYYALGYALGDSTGNLVRITWYNNATGQNWVVFQDAANSPTGFKLGYFPVDDFMGTDGYFVVQLSGGGKLYSLADNRAREAMGEPFSQKVGLAIDTSTGAFAYSAQDLGTSGASSLGSLVLARYYNGHADRLGELGYRWSHSFDTRLAITNAGDAGVVFGSGREEFFVWQLAFSSFRPADARVHATLVKNGDGSYAYTTTDNLTYHFTSAGVLSSIGDLNGNQETFAYDGSGRLHTAMDAGGRALTFAYDAGNQLTSVTDPTNAAVTYAYDANGDLISATDPLGHAEAYTYSAHRLTSVTDRNGHVLVTNSFDQNNRVVTQTDAAGKTLTIDYDAPGKGATEATDPNGHTATYYFDVTHRTTDQVDPQSHTISYVYDTVGNLQKVIDPAANQWSFA
jgi:YD repeat-containing protein